MESAFTLEGPESSPVLFILSLCLNEEGRGKAPIPAALLIGQEPVQLRSLGSLLGHGHALSKEGPLLVKPEVIEVEVAVASAFFIDEAHEDPLSPVLAQVHHFGKHGLAVPSMRLKDDLSRLLLDKLHADAGLASAPNAKAGVRVSDDEGGGRQHPLKLVVEGFFKAADPVLPLWVRPLPFGEFAVGIDFPFHRLPRESLASAGPILQGAILEIEIQRTAVRPEREAPHRLSARGGKGKRGWLR